MTPDERCRAMRRIAQESEGFVEVGSPLPPEGADAVRDDWWLALRFWFGCSFMRGRADVVSVGFLNRALKTLPMVLGDGSRADPDQLRAACETGELDWRDDSAPVFKALKREGLNNRNDCEMVVDTLRFLAALPDSNIAAWAVAQVEADGVASAYATLNELRYVGPKIASMFLREIVEVYELAGYVRGDDWAYVFPIDYWVEKVGKALGLWDRVRNELREARTAVRACIDCGVEPSQFNRGAWLIGFTRGDGGITAVVGGCQ